MLENNEKAAILNEKNLQNHLFILSKSMSSHLVEKMSKCLLIRKTITQYENQMVFSQPTDMQKASKLMQMLIRKGDSACQLFYSVLENYEPSLFERVTGFPALVSTPETHPSLEAVSQPEKEERCSSCIVHIFNSTLNNCIFGHGNYLSIVSEQPTLPQNTEETTEEQETEGSSAKCGHQEAVQVSRQPQHIQIHDSDLQYVMVGNDNTMEVNETEEEEEEDGYTEEM